MRCTLHFVGLGLLCSGTASGADHPEAAIVTHDWNTGVGIPRRVASGDLTGDGTADLVISSSSGPGGIVSLVSGPTYGRTDVHRFPSIAGMCCYLAGSVGLGDHDLDGSTDLVTAGAERTYLFLGPLSGDTGPGSADAVLRGYPGSIAGVDVDLAGDIDGDEEPDVVVGASYAGDSYEGKVYVTSGPVTGRHSLGAASTYVFVGQAFGQLGAGTTSVGDLTGDGIGDLAMASAGSPFDPGLVYLVPGGSTPGTYDPADVAWAVFSTEDGGSDLERHDVVARDYDGDGAIDLLMADRFDPGFGEFVSGAVFGVLGPFAGEESLADADVTWSTDVTIAYVGESIGAGDFDGDTQLDVAFGSTFVDDSDGVVYVQMGLASGSVDVADLPALRTPARDELGSTIAIVPDWSGDGGDEIAVGAYWGGGNYYGSVLVFESDSMF
jgi:hypothetical protein